MDKPKQNEGSREADGKQSSTIAQKFQFFVFTKFTYRANCVLLILLLLSLLLFSSCLRLKYHSLWYLIFFFLFYSMFIKILNFKLSTHRKKCMEGARKKETKFEEKKRTTKATIHIWIINARAILHALAHSHWFSSTALS